MNFKKNITLLIKTGLGVFVLWLVGHSISWKSLIHIFSQIHFGWLAIAVLITAFEFIVSSMKLAWMANDSSWAYQLKMNCVKTFMNQVLPGGMGGEAARMVYLTRFLKSPGKAASLLFMDRWSGLCGQCIWSGIGMGLFFLLNPSFSENQSQWIIASIAIMSSGILGWFWGPYGLSRLFQISPALIKWSPFQKLKHETKTVEVELNLWSSPSTKSFRLFGWVSLNQIGSLLLIYTASLSLGHEVHILLASAVMLVGALSAVLPFTLGNLGIQEAFFAFGYSAAGLNAELGVAVSLLFRLIQLVPIGLGLYFFMRGFRSTNESVPCA